MNEAPRSKLRGIKAEFRRSSPCLRAAQALAPRVIPGPSRRRAISAVAAALAKSAAWATVRCRVFRRRRIKLDGPVKNPFYLDPLELSVDY
jgi:hypothetical protein